MMLANFYVECVITEILQATVLTLIKKFNKYFLTYQSYFFC
jgi:hypothetical protein